MNAVSRRKIEMGVRALEFSRANPDADAGYGVAAAKLEQLVARAHEFQRSAGRVPMAAHVGPDRSADARLHGPGIGAEMLGFEPHEIAVNRRFVRACHAPVSRQSNRTATSDISD